MSDEDRIVNAVTETLPVLLNTLAQLETVQQKLHPPRYDMLAEFIRPQAEQLSEATSRFAETPFPEHLTDFASHITDACEYTRRACDGLVQHEQGMGQVMRAMRAICRAHELTYPLANAMAPVSNYYLEPDARTPAQLQGLQAGAEREGVGIINVNNPRDQRGGFHLYVPENLNLDEPAPLVFCLHGGTGHGADFIWSWLREARSRGFILVSPSSQQDTWSLMGEDHDLQPLLSIVDFICDKWRVDTTRILLSGMSDGATYSLLAGLQPDSPFTHLAPFSGVLHPDIIMTGQIQHAKDRPIYLVHGHLDWMFPLETAFMAEQELRNWGADLTFRPLEDVSHNFARQELPALLNWFGAPIPA